MVGWVGPQPGSGRVTECLRARSTFYPNALRATVAQTLSPDLRHGRCAPLDAAAIRQFGHDLPVSLNGQRGGGAVAPEGCSGQCRRDGAHCLIVGTDLRGHIVTSSGGIPVRVVIEAMGVTQPPQHPPLAIAADQCAGLCSANAQLRLHLHQAPNSMYGQ